MLRSIQNVGRLTALCPQSVRNLSAPAGQKLVLVDVDDKTGYATVTLNRPPVNSLNLELLAELNTALDDLQNNRSRGMILASSAPTVFSAGLDIMEMYKPNQERLKDFWTNLQDVWLKLYGSPFPTAAAIHGHAPAGGCLLSLCCEYRVMCPNYTIGLNETKLGIVAPFWFMSAMRNVLPRRVAEKALTMGTMFTTDEALKIGLVDEVATDKADAIEKCVVFLNNFKKVAPEARALTKQSFRNKDIQDLEDNRAQDVELFAFAVNQKKVQQGLEVYLQSLKQKK